MNLWQRLTSAGRAVVREFNPLETPSTPLSGPGLWAAIFGGETTEAGEHVNNTNALQQATVYACVRVISEAIASLPVKLYELLDNGRSEATDNDLYWLLRYRPNPEMTAFTYFESLAGSLALTGNCYAQIIKNKLGRVVSLWPLHPEKTKPVRLKDGNLAYRTSDGEESGAFRLIPPEGMFHVPLFSFDGHHGLSPIMLNRQLVGSSKASEKYGARFFGNGSKPGGLLRPSDGQKVDDKTLSQVRASWQAMQAGINQGKIAVLPGNWTYTQIGISPEDSQFLQTRQYNRTDIAAIFRVAPHMVGDTTRLSGNNHEQQSLQFMTDTIRPYTARFEQEIMCKLLPQTGRNSGKHIAEFDVRERLRGDFAATSQGYALGRQWGWYSVNDIRRDMGENPIGEQGDVYLAPINMENLANLTATTDAAEGNDADPEAIPDDDVRLARNLRFALPLIAVFRDGFGRLSRRNKKSSESICGIFEPALSGLAKQLREVYAGKFNLSPAWDESGAVVSEALRAMEHRYSSWNLDSRESLEILAESEFRRALLLVNAETLRRAEAASGHAS